VIRTSRRLGPLLLTLLLAPVIAGACGVVSSSPPAATPDDFQGIAGEIVSRGIHIDHLISGDAGCSDSTLTKTAIGFDASGLDQTTVVRLRIYIFGDDEAYSRLRSTIDDCAKTYVTDAATFESIDDSPYVLTSQGPWGPTFEAALRDAIVAAAAGTGKGAPGGD